MATPDNQAGSDAVALPARAQVSANWWKGYQRADFPHDLVAGATLAAAAIPVGMADASVAGVPAQVGLYCFMLGAIGYAMFCSSRTLVVGAASPIALLIAAAIGPMSGGDPQRYMELVSATTLLVGIICIVAYFLNFGRMVNFISEPILEGFKTGAGLLIAAIQLPKLFGIAGGGTSFFERVAHVIRHLPETNPWALGTGLVAFALIVGGNRLFPNRPVSIVVVIASIIAMTRTGLADHGIKVVGDITPGLPHLGFPTAMITNSSDLLPLALACFLLAFVEAMSVAKGFAAKNHPPIQPGRELLGLGAANVLGGVGGSMPVGTSMSTSAVNRQAGARSPVSLLTSAAIIAAVLMFLTRPFESLPQPLLAALVFNAVGGMIKIHDLRKIRAISKPEFRVAISALVGVLVFGVLEGILLAAVFSLITLIARAEAPDTAVLGKLPGTSKFVDISRNADAVAIPEALVFRFYASLVYFNADNVKQAFLDALSRATPPVKAVVIDCSYMPAIDLTGIEMLCGLAEDAESRGMAFRLAELNDRAAEIIERSGAAGRLGNARAHLRTVDAVNHRLEEPS